MWSAEELVVAEEAPRSACVRLPRYREGSRRRAVPTRPLTNDRLQLPPMLDGDVVIGPLPPAIMQVSPSRSFSTAAASLTP